MPEGPELHVITEEMNSILKGARATHITVVDGPFRFNEKPIYANFRQGVAEFNRFATHNKVVVEFVRNKGKYMYLRLISEERDVEGNFKYERFMLSHLSLGGNWLTIPGAHMMVVLRYIDANGKEQKLYYHDHRHRGKLYMFTREQAKAWLARIGPDVLSRGFTREIYDQIMARPKVQKMTIDVMIMEQEFFSGVGNYLRAEILNAAHIDPRRKISSFSKVELSRLYKAIVDKTSESYAARGTTLDTYRDVYGREGGYKPVIYDKAKDPKGNSIVKYKDVNGRTMHWVPATQK